MALGASGGERLVVYTLDSQSPSDTFTRVLRLAHTADGDPLWTSLAENLRLIIDLRPGSGTQPRVSRSMLIDSRARAFLNEGDIASLKHLALAPA